MLISGRKWPNNRKGLIYKYCILFFVTLSAKKSDEICQAWIVGQVPFMGGSSVYSDRGAAARTLLIKPGVPSSPLTIPAEGIWALGGCKPNSITDLFYRCNFCFFVLFYEMSGFYKRYSSLNLQKIHKFISYLRKKFE